MICQTYTTRIMALTATALAFALPASGQAAPYYAGKTIEINVSRGSGGSQDRICRFLAKHLIKFLPGAKRIIVRNRPGGTGVVAVNWLYNQAPKDGTVVGCFLPVRHYQAWFWGGGKSRGLKADMEKLVGLAGTPVVAITYVRTDIGGAIKRPMDLKNAPSFKTGGQSITNTKDLSFRAVFDLSGVKYHYTTGYQNSSDAWAAVLRNEVQHHTSGFGHYMKIVVPTGIKTGIVVPIFYTGSVVIKALEPAVPASEFITMLGGKASGPLWNLYQASQAWRVFYMPPGVPEEAMSAFESGFAKMLADPAFREDHKKLYKVYPSWVAGRSVIERELVAAFRSSGKELGEFRKAYIDKVRR